MENSLNRTNIMSILPHRGNMLLLDEAYLLEGKAHGIYRIRGDEWFLDGHFPGNPVVPGVILCEILAQSACVLLEGRIEEGATPYFAGISEARFKEPVKPGDTVETECEIIKSKGPFYFASGKVFVGTRLCAKAEFSFAVMA